MKRWVWALFLVFLIGSGFFAFKLYKKPLVKGSQQPSSVQETTTPQLISVSPNPKEVEVIIPNQIVEITFNQPLENEGELKLRIDTFKDFKIELVGDRRTAKIIPTKPYPLGQSFTFFIGPDTKFDGKKTFGHEENFTFRTIEYHGV